MFNVIVRQSHLEAMKLTALDGYEVNSPTCSSKRGAGIQVSKLIAVAGATSAVNMFLVSGLTRLLNFVAIFEDVTNVVDITAVHLDVWDGASTDITLAAGVDCSGVIVNSALVKADDATGALILMNSANASIEDTTKQQILDPGPINAKEGTATYLRFNWTNADTNLDCQVRCYAEWRSFCGGAGEIVAV